MLLRSIYRICQICHHLNMYRQIFSKRLFRSFSTLIHGVILSESAVSCKKISAMSINASSQQEMSYLLSDKGLCFNLLNQRRLEIHNHFSTKQAVQENYTTFYLKIRVKTS